jgi:ribosome-interacting GTPase 1
MPANLTPEYEKAELRYRQSTTDEERLACLQEMLAAIPKHKGTEKMQADLKRRISQLRKEGQKSGLSKGPDPFHVPKSGAGQGVLAGLPNTGKSSILAATTHAEVKVAEYPFTTLVPQPGMWLKDDVQIELVDTPPFTQEHVPPGLMGTLRNADLIAIVVEATDNALEQAETALAVLKSREIRLRSETRGRLQARNESGVLPGLIVANKSDFPAADVLAALRGLYQPELEIVAVSARERTGLDDLFACFWKLLDRVRVYSKEPGRAPDLHKPFTLPAGSTVAELALQIHRDLPERMKFARLWGHSRFDGQQVHKTEVLQDKDIVEIHE